MIGRLRLIFALVLLTILATTAWASLRLPMWHTPQSVVLHPWFLATLTDTYLAFFTFWLWVAYKEDSVASRLLWLLLIFALGNIAMAAYMLLQLLRLAPSASIEDLLLKRKRPQ